MILMLAVGALALAGCGAGPTADGPGYAPVATSPATAAPAPTDRPTGAPEPTAGAAAPTGAAAEPSPSGPKPGGAGGTSVRPPDALVLAAQRQLAAHLKLDPSAVALQSANQRDWPDGALGCPAPGMAYPQIVTPGFLLVFTDPAQAQQYEVHTAMGAGQMVLCANQQPVDLAAPAGAAGAPVPTAPAPAAPASVIRDAAALDPAGKRALASAQAALASELGVAGGAVSFVQAEAVEWNDSSLGCPKPDQVYMQVITPGYKITLQAQGRSYEYHTDSGKRAVRCESA
jgi:hypothetical protein